MSIKPGEIPLLRLIWIGFLSWLAVLGIDFFFHAGLLADLYTESVPSMLAPEDAFKLIPLGYLSILIQVVLLLWLIVRLDIQTGRDGAIFGGKLGFLLGSSMLIGMLSIYVIPWRLLLGSGFAQIMEMAVAGAVIGSGVGAENTRTILFRVVAFVIFLLFLTIAMQNLG